MSKHTPGPWEVLNETDVFTVLGADRGDGIKAIPSDGWMIADCGESVTFTATGQADMSREIRKANARLISAAPQLLEALTEAAEILWVLGQIGPSPTALEKSAEFKSLIAKATA
ncbi:hypothetical protein ACRCOS_01080 [Pseudomonas aeruginosa]|uniref:hypothetical protein n=1 Tax=Pseudomonas aeruginosa TaxID=287 RepID=UPI002739AC62|nr:hypothetical protein [Pseudomonas aeruginosa]